MKSRRYNYHTTNSFQYKPVLFHEIKHLGFNPMHKRIRVIENIAHMAEHKYAKTHHFNLYCDSKTKGDAVKLAHAHFKTKFKNQLGIKYFVPDRINGWFAM